MALVDIRIAGDADVPAIARVVHDSFAGFIPLIGRAPWPMFQDYLARVAQGAAWVLTEDGAVVGVVVLQFQKDHLFLEILAVAPSHQGKGHGRRLLDFAEAEARRRGHDETRIHMHLTMARSIAIYRKHGYTEYARTEEDGYHRVYLRKRLREAGAPR
ncbi:MAG TPA: GNAT family N-acetyltransferase [Stellaceae bacterium]|nr:GNAT family N-acetyltransferase [Stellaceae bacterium]